MPVYVVEEGRDSRNSTELKCLMCRTVIYSDQETFWVALPDKIGLVHQECYGFSTKTTRRVYS